MIGIVGTRNALSPYSSRDSVQVAGLPAAQPGPIPAVVSSMSSPSQYLAGIAMQLVNELTHRVHMPGFRLPPGPLGDVLEPATADARRGATLVERLAHRITGVVPAPSPDAVMMDRPLLASTRVQADGIAPVALMFDAAAPNATWTDATRASAPVAVYVDGTYSATTLVVGEHPGSYSVNLGVISAGAHDVELRFASDRAPRNVQAPVVAHVRGVLVTGDAALAERYAPIIEMRDAAASSGPMRSAWDDAPLAVFPVVHQTMGGGRIIEYHVVFSNENGGTKTADLMSQYGNTLDVEPIFRVQLDATGRLMTEQYQAPLHHWTEFTGDRSAGRPIVRVSTTNNLVSSRITTSGAERWSNTLTLRTSTLNGTEPVMTDADVIRVSPWIRSITERELQREGKIATQHPSRNQIYSPERYLMMGPVTLAQRDAIRAAGAVRVLLHDGRQVSGTVERDFADGEYLSGGVLLPEGVTRNDVVGVALT